MTIEDRYVARTPGSAAVGHRAEAVMPAGDTRAAGYHRPYPLTVTHGLGTSIWDVDGNEYTDFSYNFTSLAHGHAYPPIVEAATEALRGGTAWPARNPAQVELAELLTGRVASLEQVRFCNSGSEANMLALAVAREVTGRTKMLMARHGYHGSHEAFEAGFFARHEWPHTLLAEWGDAKSFEAVLAEHGSDIAGVFLEGVMGSSGVISAPPEFFKRVQAAAHAAGALFVLDEVITLRLATGGHQAVLGISPDLTTMGKIIGGGFPVGAVGGKREYMAMLDPRENRIFHSGTFNGNPVTMAAGLASVRALTSDAIGTMGDQMTRLVDALETSAARHGLPFSARCEGSIANVYFAPEPPSANLNRADLDIASCFHLAGLTHGLFFSSRGMLVNTTVMTDTILDDAIARFDAALADVAAEL
jgi:glutamate-1-semialdehyde 2,1-aminomutase